MLWRVWYKWTIQRLNKPLSQGIRIPNFQIIVTMLVIQEIIAIVLFVLQSLRPAYFRAIQMILNSF
ncbi:MAG: hypothetical protein C9356_11150 [Oleiphilus sp.]|nr:MAG: hypothetical protein C9356_11150 [Oleiphilus sp.]